MTLEERNAFDALKARKTFIGLDPNAYLMIAKKIFPDKNFYLPTDKNLRLHKDDGYFCMVLPYSDPEYGHDMWFYAPTEEERKIIITTLSVEVVKSFYPTTDKIKKILETEPKSVKYFIDKDGKVNISWLGDHKGREQTAKALFEKCSLNYPDIFDKIKNLQDVKSDKLSLIYNKFFNLASNHHHAMWKYITYGYDGYDEIKDKFDSEGQLKKFFSHAEQYIDVVDRAQKELQAVLKECRHFNFSNRDIALFLGLPGNTEINEKQIMTALNQAAIKYDFMEKTDNGWAIQFDRRNFIRFANVMYHHVKLTIKEPKNLANEIEKTLNEYSVDQEIKWLEEDERSGQAFRDHIYKLFVQRPIEIRKNELFDLINNRKFDEAKIMIDQMPDLLLEQVERSYNGKKQILTPILAVLAQAHPDNKNNNDEDIKGILSFCKVLLDHPDVSHLKLKDANGNTLLHKAIYYRHRYIEMGRTAAAQQFEKIAYHLLDKAPDLAGCENEGGEPVYGKKIKPDNHDQFDKDNSFKIGYDIHKLRQLFQMLNKKDLEIDQIESFIKNKPYLLNAHSTKKKHGNPTPLFSLMYRIVHTPDAAQQRDLKELLGRLINDHQETINFTEPNGDASNTLLHYALYNPVLADTALSIVDILAQRITLDDNPLNKALIMLNKHDEAVFDNWSTGYRCAVKNKMPEIDILPYKKIFDIILKTDSLSHTQLSAMKQILNIDIKIGIKNADSGKKNVEIERESPSEPELIITSSPEQLIHTDDTLTANISLPLPHKKSEPKPENTIAFISSSQLMDPTELDIGSGDKLNTTVPDDDDSASKKEVKMSSIGPKKSLLTTQLLCTELPVKSRIDDPDGLLEIMTRLRKKLHAYKDRTPCLGLFSKKTFSDKDCDNVYAHFVKTDNNGSVQVASSKQAISSIYWLLDKALAAKDLPGHQYYGDSYSIRGRAYFGGRGGKMLSILESVKNQLEKKFEWESRIYKVIYMEFQKYLHPVFGTASGTFKYNDIFGVNGYAMKLFLASCEGNNSTALDATIASLKQNEVIRKRTADWKNRDGRDKLFQKPDELHKSDMARTFDKIKEILVDKKLIVDAKVSNLLNPS